MKILTLATATLLGATMLAGGCRKEADSPKNEATKPAPKKIADTPQKALLAMRDALRDGQSEEYAACFDATDEEKKFMEALCQFTSAMHDLQNAMIEEYGKENVDARNNPIFGDLNKENWIEDYEIQINGAAATAMRKDGVGREITFLKNGDAWRIGLSILGDKMPTAAEQKKIIQDREQMLPFIKAAHDKIGKEGYDSDKINMELFTEIRAATTPKVSPPETPEDQ